MNNQSLDNNEILGVKWAHDDPNPVAVEANKRADKDAIMAKLKSQQLQIQAAPFDYPDNYELPAPKRARLAEVDNGADADSLYPNTDAQIARCKAEASAAGPMTQDVAEAIGQAEAAQQEAQAAQQNYDKLSAILDRIEERTQGTPQGASQPAPAAEASTSAGHAVAAVGYAGSGAQVPAGWQTLQDPAGNWYYWSAVTGETAWELPPTAQSASAALAAAPTAIATPAVPSAYAHTVQDNATA